MKVMPNQLIAHRTPAEAWRWAIGYERQYYHGPRMVGVSIYKWGSGFEKITIGAGYCSTEAEALMRAYLSALSGERI